MLFSSSLRLWDVNMHSRLLCRNLLLAAQKVCRAPWAAFELCVRNADKGALSQSVLESRVSMFQERGLDIFLTNATTFPQKSRLFPGCKFVVGYDTAIRILDKKYYSDSEVQMAEELLALKSKGCSFVVAGRREAGGSFKTVDDISLEPALREQNLFQGIHEDLFREDVSSTELRQQCNCLEEPA
jgi:hypothetical protein